MKHQVWPDAWKTAYVSPLHKKQNNSDVTNYRPISLLPKLSLGLERVLFDHVYLKIRYKVSSSQYGFMSRRSTVTQLLSFCDKIFEGHEQGLFTTVFYADIKKAFDSVRHDRLLYKLASYGLDHDFLELLHSYLSNRYQRVRIDGMLSEIASVTSGVPQGSILGPLLFLLFVNDLPPTLSISSFLFADDLKCCSVNSTSLQTDLSALQRWCTENFLDLHPEKCKIL